ncbi:MAG TPA: CsbD family protein [Geobacterales bacterium]|nr:CsbD family protein [Geobacterales bacterium]
MNWDQIAGDWKQFEGRVQKQWGKLTNDDLQQAKGDQRILAGKIQERYGITKEEAERQIKTWHDSL